MSFRLALSRSCLPSQEGSGLKRVRVVASSLSDRLPSQEGSGLKQFNLRVEKERKSLPSQEGSGLKLPPSLPPFQKNRLPSQEGSGLKRFIKYMISWFALVFPRKREVD